jgi:glycosyltransferase involved in cell wall biosynthesis
MNNGKNPALSHAYGLSSLGQGIIRLEFSLISGNFPYIVPRVSVIIPTYNRAVLVQEAVASVLAQTYRDFELLVVDDGSTDGTLKALAPFTGKIKVLSLPARRGVSGARNAGIAGAQGEWLAFLDADDLWLPGKIARQLAFMEDNPRLLLNQTEEIWVRRGLRVNPPRSHVKAGGDLFLRSLERCLVSPSAVVLHRRLLDEHGGFDEALPAAEDYDLWLRLTWRYEVGLLPEPLIIKRGGHADQLSRQWGLDRYRIRALQKLLAEPELPEAYRRAAWRTLQRKCAIYAQGCEKRGKVEEAQFFRRLGSEEEGVSPLNSNPHPDAT